MTSYIEQDQAGGFTACLVLFNDLARSVSESWLRWLS